MYPPERFVILFGELAAYRDDSHIAAWLAHNIEGNRWELLTTIWRGEINTLDTLYEELSSVALPEMRMLRFCRNS